MARAGTASREMEDKPVASGGMSMSENTICRSAICSEDLLSLIIDLIPHPVFVKDENGCFLLANRATGGLGGIPAEQMIGHRADQWLTDREAWAQIADQDRRVIEEGIALYSVETKVIDPRGNLHIYEISKVPIALTGGKKGVLGVAVEVTRSWKVGRELEKLVAEKELVLKEVHHRIKNNMNNMVMLLTIQAETLTDPVAVAALYDARSRIQTMMVIYDRLYRSSDFLNLSIKDYLVSLVEEVKKTFPKHERIKVHLKIKDVKMDSRKLFQVGIILNELFTNAMKYAYQENQSGSIVVEVNEFEDLIELAVQDFGKGLPPCEEDKPPEGFGLELVRMLAIQIGGSLTVKKGNGVRFVVKIKK